jgi:hypothetical protein
VQYMYTCTPPTTHYTIDMHTYCTYLLGDVDGAAVQGRVQREGQHQRVGHEVEGGTVPLTQLPTLAQEVQAGERGWDNRKVSKKSNNNKAKCGLIVWKLKSTRSMRLIFSAQAITSSVT